MIVKDSEGSGHILTEGDVVELRGVTLGVRKPKPARYTLGPHSEAYWAYILHHPQEYFVADRVPAAATLDDWVWAGRNRTHEA